MHDAGLLQQVGDALLQQSYRLNSLITCPLQQHTEQLPAASVAGVQGTRLPTVDVVVSQHETV